MNRSSFLRPDFSSFRRAISLLLPPLAFCFLLGAACFFLPPALLGQTAGTGALAGAVTDPSGASVADAKVKLTNEATGEVRAVVSNAAGNYIVTLPPMDSTDWRFLNKV